MKINIIELIPRGWNIEILKNNFIKVSYETLGRGNDPKSFILPKEILVNGNLIESLSAYIGDGKLSEDVGHLDFTSKDSDIIKLVHDFFKNTFNIEKMYYRISCKKLTKNSINYWADYLKISKKDIRIRESHRFRHECFNFQISGKIFVEIFKRIIAEIFKINFLEYPSLRQAFLRGLFAADGSVNINKQENYLVYIGYHFSYNKEEKLAEFVQKLLKMEGIESRLILREDKGERYLQITNWRNYSKCWKISLFDLCKRKKDVFVWKLDRIKLRGHRSDDLKLALMT